MWKQHVGQRRSLATRLCRLKLQWLGRGLPMSKATLRRRYGAALDREGMKGFSQFDGAEIMAREFAISRPELDAFAVER